MRSDIKDGSVSQANHALIRLLGINTTTPLIFTKYYNIYNLLPFLKPGYVILICNVDKCGFLK